MHKHLRRLVVGRQQPFGTHSAFTRTPHAQSERLANNCISQTWKPHSHTNTKDWKNSREWAESTEKRLENAFGTNFWVHQSKNNLFVSMWMCVLDYALIESNFECEIYRSVSAIFFFFSPVECLMRCSTQTTSAPRFGIFIKIEWISNESFAFQSRCANSAQLPQSFSISEFSSVQFMSVNQNSCSPLWWVKQMRWLRLTHLI